MPTRRLTKKEYARALRIHREKGCPNESLGICLGPGADDIAEARQEVAAEEVR